jgi:hypothetical protein
MEMGFESFAARLGKSAATPALHPCDWHGLHARLVAAHAARRALLAEFGTHAPVCGSFDPLAAQALGALEEELMTVNLTALADGKAEAGKELDVAAAQVPGGRGT